MSLSSKLTLRVAIIALGVLLLAGLLLTATSATQKANAMDPTEWATVAGAIDTYINNQYVATDDGEAGFVLQGGPYTGTGTTLKDRIDSNNDGVILGEGDDAANAPVLIDVYSPFTTFIPGTSYRLVGAWRTGADATNAPALAGKVDDHRTAGFSTDIVSYCVTGHTESPNAMSWGAMSAAGYFGSPNPVVLDLKWGRLGWGGVAGDPTYAGAQLYTASLATPTPSALATTADCAGITPASELVRCAADAGMANVGLPVPWDVLDDPLYQPVDLRSSITNTIANQTTGGPYAIQDPLQTLFSSTGSWANLALLDSSGARNIVFMNRTQHTAGMAAQGARMLGYQADFLRWGLPMWNSGSPPAWPEQFVGAANRGYDYPMASGTVDTTAPTITAVPSATTSCGGATITWTTDEPATSVVEWSTIAGGPYTAVNDTVLHATHSVNLVGLPDGTTIYYRVSSYDGNANGTTSVESSFDTPTNGKPSPLSMSMTSAYWNTLADYNARLLSVDFVLANNGSDSAYNVTLTGSTADNGVTVSSGIPATIGTLGGGGGAGGATVVYHVPTGVGSFMTTNTATAEDGCGNVYNYPPA